MNAGLGQPQGYIEMTTGGIGDHRRLGAKSQRLIQARNAMIDTGFIHIRAISMPQYVNLQIGDKLSNQPRMTCADTPEANNQ